jgi:hypothetical protein
MASFSLNTSSYSEQGYVRVTWAGTTSANHYSFRVYRLDPTANDWTLIRERTDLAQTFSYDDYSAPNGTVQYAVVEVTVSGNNRVEQTKTPQTVTLGSGYYWLVHPTDNSKSIQLRDVKSDEFGMEREVEVLKLMGRGRKIDVGDNWGRTGAISARIYNRPDRTARQIRQDIEAAKDTNQYYFLRTPFGDMWKIWFDDPKFSRLAGVGTSEFVDLSFNYYEVA